MNCQEKRAKKAKAFAFAPEIFFWFTLFARRNLYKS